MKPYLTEPFTFPQSHYKERFTLDHLPSCRRGAVYFKNSLLKDAFSSLGYNLTCFTLKDCSIAALGHYSICLGTPDGSGKVGTVFWRVFYVLFFRVFVYT